MYDIEDGVPIPKRSASGGRKPLYPFAQLKVGQSFFIPYEDVDDVSIRRTKARIARAVTGANRPNKDDASAPAYTYRPVENGVRVWRNK